MSVDSSQTEIQKSYKPCDVVLRDGLTVHIRPIQPDDESGLLELFRSMSPESRWLRFFAPVKESSLSAEAHREANIDYGNSFGLVATTGLQGRIIGHAFYSRIDEKRPEDARRAEVAFSIANEYQGRGLGTILLGQLAKVAAENNIGVFEAEVMSANHKMLGVFRQSGFHVEVKVEAGQLSVSFPTEFTREAIERFEHREQIAASAALKLFLSPRSVAVIGASRNRDSIGGTIFNNLLSYGFEGLVYPVNPSADVIQCIRAYPSVEDIPGDVDLAVIVVPAAHVIKTAEQCALKKVGAIVVISADFAETGEEGRARQTELLKVCRASGMRLIGPNCMGIMNTSSAVRLDATFARSVPPAGRVGFSSQSGALGLAIIEYAGKLGLGISSFVSVGNKADISGNDLLCYWEDDAETDVILLYLESFGRPRKFSRIARRVGRKKPIVAVKSGRSTAGARATSSHTGALLAASDVTVDALFRQSGVIRTDALEELFDVAALLSNQPLPAGNRVGILTNGGGPAILCADACEAGDLEVPMLADSTRARLRDFLPSAAGVSNPVDMIASATADDYKRAIRVMADDPNIDSLIVIFIPPLGTKAEDASRAILDAVREIEGSKPVLAVFMSAHGLPEELKAADICVPSYTFPESAARALSQVSRYASWRKRPETTPPQFDNIRRDEAAAIVATALLREDGWLTPEETSSLLSCYGVPLVEQRFVQNAEEARLAADDIKSRVVLKAVAPDLLHKSEMGAVRLNLQGGEQTRAAALEMAERLKSYGQTPTGYIVQQQVEGGVEMIVGVVHDSQFGPVVAVGAGGVQVELMRDLSVRLTPITREDASQMIRELKTFPLLTGFRGSAECDLQALEDGVLRISAMVEDLPEIAELDCNPFIVHRNGAVVLDARIRVSSAGPPELLGARR